MNWEWSAFFVTFWTVFIAELGDKTQLATIGFAAKGRPLLSIFAGSALALVIAALLATVLGGVLVRVIEPAHLNRGAGVLFIVLGILMLTGRI